MKEQNGEGRGGFLGLNFNKNREPKRELLDLNSVEVKIGDPNTAAPQLLKLYTDPSIIEHLEKVEPYPEDPEEINRREEEIKEAFRTNPNLTLITAETPSGLIVASSIVEKMSEDRAEISKVVVHPDYRGPKIVDDNGDLIRAVDLVIKTDNALIFSEDGLDCSFAEAFTIVGTRDEKSPDKFEPMDYYERALNAFRRNGYEAGGDRSGATRSYSIKEGKMVTGRVSQPVVQTRRRYKQDFPNDHLKFFPKQNPSMNSMK